MASGFSNQVQIAGRNRYYRCFLNVDIYAISDTQCRIDYQAYGQMYWAFQYGLAVTCNGQTGTGVLGSSPGGNWANVCSVAGSIVVNRNSTNYNYTVTARAYGTTVNGYGGAPGSTNDVGVTVTVPARSSYTVSYNANGGSGAPGNQVKSSTSNIILSSTIPTRPGYIFMGWGTSATDTTPDYQPGSTYSTNANITLYAIWEEAVPMEITPNIGSLTYRVLCTSQMLVNESILSSLRIPFSPKYVGTNYSLDFYYRLSDAGRTVSEVFGPYTANDIGDGGDVGDNGYYLIPSKAMILASLKAFKDPSKIRFYVDTKLMDDNFEETDLSMWTGIVDVPLEDYIIMNVEWPKVVAYNESNKTVMSIPINIPESYTPSQGSYTAECNSKQITGTVLVGSIGIPGRGLITIDQNLATAFGKSNFYSTENTITFTITDNITELKFKIRLKPVSDQDIYILKSGGLKCTEVIEDPSVTTPIFQKGGRIIAKEFIETTTGVVIGDTFYVGEILEYE